MVIQMRIRMKKYLLPVLTGVLLATTVLSACGKSTATGSNSSVNQNGIWFPYDTVITGKGAEDSFITTAPALNAKEVYAKMKYSPILFYGTHVSFKNDGNSFDKSLPGDDFLANMEWKEQESYLGLEDDLFDGETYQVSALPYYFSAGTGNDIEYLLEKINDRNWCKLKFAAKNKETGEIQTISIDAAYDVKDGELLIEPLSEINGDVAAENGVVTYSYSGVKLNYRFAFEGQKLIFSAGNVKCELVDVNFLALVPGNGLFTAAGEYPALDGYIPGIEKISIFGKEQTKEVNYSSVTFPAEAENDYAPLVPLAYRLSEDGVIQVAFKDKDGNIQSFEYVIFPLGATGVAFSDGTHNYAYLSSYVSFIDDKFKNVSGLNVTEKDQEKLATLKEEDLKTLQDTKNQMLEDFKEALANVGVNAVINSDTGEILFDSSILFAKNESSVSEEGKIALENFSKVFSEILKKEEYQNFLAQVKIQGHTDSDGDYDYNKTLSQERADAVKNCIMENLSDDAGASALCEKLFATEGCASDYLITDENGAEDKTASRRVVFVFYIDLDYLNQ